jgi:hypothetical protein
MSPTFSYGGGGRIYRYYVSAALQQGARRKPDGVVRRVSGPAIEALVKSRLAMALPGLPDPVQLLRQVRVLADRVELVLPEAVRSNLAADLPYGMTSAISATEKAIEITAPVRFPLRGGRRSVTAGCQEADPDDTLIAALRRAHAMIGRDRDGRPYVEAAPASHHDRRILRLAFLAPDLQRDILAGRQPSRINLEQLTKLDIPLAWDRQRQALRW